MVMKLLSHPSSVELWRLFFDILFECVTYRHLLELSHESLHDFHILLRFVIAVLIKLRKCLFDLLDVGCEQILQSVVDLHHLDGILVSEVLRVLVEGHRLI